MAIYNLQQFTVLVAEDNAFIRRLLFGALKALNVGDVITVADGGEAIEALKERGAKEPGSAEGPVDIIVTNWVMAPVDGLMLLQWARRHKESPNRFIPIIMVTGYADKDKVEEARALGVTEFLGKPFSVQALCERVISVIDNPRHFILVPTYFGPDRRRQELAFKGENRRLTTEDDLEYIDGR